MKRGKTPMDQRSHPKSKFTQEEDVKLSVLVSKFKPKRIDWVFISHLMNNRNARQCKERWEKYLNPAINKNPFSPQEDLLLILKYTELGPKWVMISQFFYNRSDISIKNRFMVLKRRGLIKHTVNATKNESEVDIEEPNETQAHSPDIIEESRYVPDTTHSDADIGKQNDEKLQSKEIDDSNSNKSNVDKSIEMMNIWSSLGSMDVGFNEIDFSYF